MEPFIAQIMLFGGNFAPRGWAFCDGSLLPISQNTALFSLIGTIYGGDGRTTFALPDLRGRAPIHQGHMPGGQYSYRLGQRGGQESNTLNTSHLPAHNHPVSGSGGGISGSATATISGAPGVTMNVSDDNDAGEEPNGNYLGKNDAGALYASGHNGTMASGAISADAETLAVSVDTSGLSVNMSGLSTGNTGGGQPIQNMQPYIAMNYIIALQGIFPSRS